MANIVSPPEFIGDVGYRTRHFTSTFDGLATRYPSTSQDTRVIEDRVMLVVMEVW